MPTSNRNRKPVVQCVFETRDSERGRDSEGETDRETSERAMLGAKCFRNKPLFNRRAII